MISILCRETAERTESSDESTSRDFEMCNLVTRDHLVMHLLEERDIADLERTRSKSKIISYLGLIVLLFEKKIDFVLSMERKWTSIYCSPGWLGNA